MMGRPTLVVPGLNGSGDQHWQRHWLADDPDAELVEQDDWADPQADNWLERLERAIEARPGAFVVGHSLGAVLTARLAKSPVAALVGGALLVAPADIERTSTLHARNYEFGAMPQTPLPFPALVVASRNDPYMHFEKSRLIAQAWRAPLIDIGEAGHINVASGYGRWTAGYDLAAQVLVRAKDVHNPQPAPPRLASDASLA